jgi:hypothetical protein
MKDKFLMGILKWEEQTGKNFLEMLDRPPTLKELAELYEAIENKKPESFEDLILFKIKLNDMIAQSFLKASEHLTEEEKFVLETINKKGKKKKSKSKKKDAESDGEVLSMEDIIRK